MREGAVAKVTIGKGNTDWRDNAGAGLVNSERWPWDAPPPRNLLVQQTDAAERRTFDFHFHCQCGRRP